MHLNPRRTAKFLGHRFLRARAQHFPRLASTWAHNDVGVASPHQGWKIHVSATILNAGEILDLLGPFCTDRKLPAKAVKNLAQLKKLNSGLHHGYSQVGKAFTLYVGAAEQLKTIAHDLAEMLSQFDGPVVPFDLKVPGSTVVYYRYGILSGSDGPHLISPDGDRVPDDRQKSPPFPPWERDPFVNQLDCEELPEQLAGYPAFKCQSQRGKSGVFLSLDLLSAIPRACIVKEGRRHGEINWEGHDGASLGRNEVEVLHHLRRQRVSVPQVIDAFDVNGSAYAVIEHVKSLSLNGYARKSLVRREKRVVRLRILRSLAHELAKIHRTGVAWRDLKPANVLVGTRRRITLIDFEAATGASLDIARAAWGSVGLLPPEWASGRKEDRRPQDVYAFGKLIDWFATLERRREPAARKRQSGKSCPSSLVKPMLIRNPKFRPKMRQVARALVLTTKQVPRREPPGRSSLLG